MRALLYLLALITGLSLADASHAARGQQPAAVGVSIGAGYVAGIAVSRRAGLPSSLRPTERWDLAMTFTADVTSVFTLPEKTIRLSDRQRA